MNEDLKKAVTELYFYEKTRTAGGFMTQLFQLIQKADSDNKARIRMGFPNEVEAMELWNNAENYGDDLFKEYGLMK